MPYGEYNLRFLHISDIHARGAGEMEHWRRRRVLGKAWKRNLEALVGDEGGIDFVFFTGDAAQSGRKSEFDEVTAFFHDLLDELHLDTDRLFVVPGNHDIDRSVRADAWRALRMRTSTLRDFLNVSRWMNGIGKAPERMKDAWREEVLERQSAYREWVRSGLGRPALAPDGLGYHVKVELPNWPFPIHVAGLDTSWLCGDDADAMHLLLTENQAGRHLTEDPGLKIVLMHHPLQDLADASQARRMLADHSDLVLRGHLHETEAVEWISPDRHLRELAAGCLYEGGLADHYKNSCHFVRLEVNAQGRPAEAMVRLRSFSPTGGHWFDDNGLYRESKEGRVRWSFHLPTVAKKPNPYSPWEPRPDHCFGRTDLLRRLERAFDERRSMWLVGDWRIGKTTLLMAWEKRLRERGVVAKLVSGQGAAGVSAGRFVEAVTGLDAPSDADGAADRLTAWIEAVSTAGLPPVVLVDEVESIVQSCDVRFFDRLRDLLGKVCLVFSSNDVPDEVFSRNNKTSPITNRMETAWVGLLEPEGAEATIRLGSDTITSSDADLMRLWCGRHSYFLQLFGRYLVDARQNGQGAEEALHMVQMQAPMHFRPIWKTMGEPLHQALRDAARGLPAKAGVLERRGLVTEDGKPFGELLAAWLRGEIGK